MGEYLALGLAGHSYMENYRFANTDNLTKDGDYVQILTSGYYMISYLPCFDGFMLEDSYVEETADLFMYLDGEYVPLTINEDNTVTYEGLVADTSTNISFISNNYTNYYPITIDSNTDSSIAYVYESSGISLVFFNKAGTYDLTYNVEIITFYHLYLFPWLMDNLVFL